MKKDKNETGEDFLLKKIRYYQGTIEDYETYWNRKIEQSKHEISKETKSCKEINADLNKAFEIIPVTPDTDVDDKKEKKNKKRDD